MDKQQAANPAQKDSMPHLVAQLRVVHALLGSIIPQLQQTSILVPFVRKVSFMSISKLLAKLARTGGINTKTMQQQLLANDALLANNFTIVTLPVRRALVANIKLPIHKQVYSVKFVLPGKNLLLFLLTVNFARTANTKQ